MALYSWSPAILSSMSSVEKWLKDCELLTSPFRSEILVDQSIQLLTRLEVRPLCDLLVLFLDHVSDRRNRHLSCGEVHAVKLGNQVLLNFACLGEHGLADLVQVGLSGDFEEFQYKRFLIEVVSHVVAGVVLHRVQDLWNVVWFDS